MFVHSVIVLRK